MSRLWSRFGLRTLSILLLVFGLVGGAYLSYDRNTQQRGSATIADPRFDNDRLALQAQQAQSQQLNAQLLAAIAAAQTAAQKQAVAAAAAAAEQARKAEAAARAKRAATASRSDPRPPSNGPIPKSCSTYTGNRALGCSLLLSAGFALSEMPCLDKMWTRESNWRTTAENPSSHSYGIPQSLPASKMATIGADYRTNPATQIKWGLGYIKQRYGSPCQAWSFWQTHNFY